MAKTLIALLVAVMALGSASVAQAMPAQEGTAPPPPPKHHKGKHPPSGPKRAGPRSDPRKRRVSAPGRARTRPAMPVLRDGRKVAGHTAPAPRRPRPGPRRRHRRTPHNTPPPGPRPQPGPGHGGDGRGGDRDRDGSSRPVRRPPAVGADARRLLAARHALRDGSRDGALTPAIADALALANKPGVRHAARRIRRRERRVRTDTTSYLDAIWALRSGDRDGRLTPGIARRLALGADPAVRRLAHERERRLNGRYVALGDSYSAGTGTRDYAFSDSCERGALAYGGLLSDTGRRFSFAACSGDTTEDVLRDQIGSLTRNTRLVTISVGGNDAGFGDVVSTCVKPWASEGSCLNRLGDARRFIQEDLPGRLDETYGTIRRLAPKATIVVVGYPHPFSEQAETTGEQCNLATVVGAPEVRGINDTGDLLARTVRDRVHAFGFRFVDTRGAFEGHGVCDAEEWINGISRPVGESYHPNAAGHEAVAELIQRKLPWFPILIRDAAPGLTDESICEDPEFRSARLQALRDALGDIRASLAEQSALADVNPSVYYSRTEVLRRGLMLQAQLPLLEERDYLRGC